MSARVVRGLVAAQEAVAALSSGAPAASLAPLSIVVDDCPPLAGAYARLASCVRARLGVAQADASEPRVRLSCPACGVAFLSAASAGFKRLTLEERCAHCDATLDELQRHLDAQSYPRDAREVSGALLLAKLEEELEHVRRLAGLEHPTTVRWERRVADEALRRGQLERARGLLARAARASAQGDDDARAEVQGELGCLALAEGRLDDAERALEQARGDGHRHVLATLYAALGRADEARDALTRVAASCGWPADVVTAQLAARQ